MVISEEKILIFDILGTQKMIYWNICIYKFIFYLHK